MGSGSSGFVCKISFCFYVFRCGHGFDFVLLVCGPVWAFALDCWERKNEI